MPPRRLQTQLCNRPVAKKMLSNPGICTCSVEGSSYLDGPANLACFEGRILCMPDYLLKAKGL